MKIVDISNQIHTELGSPSDLSIPAIAFWVRANVGTLNNLIHENFLVKVDSLEIVIGIEQHEIDAEAVSIIKKMYKVHHYDLRILANLTSITNDSILELSDSGHTIRKINKNEVTKALAAIKAQESIELKNLIHSYISRCAKPAQVIGEN